MSSTSWFLDNPKRFAWSSAGAIVILIATGMWLGSQGQIAPRDNGPQDQDSVTTQFSDQSSQSSASVPNAAPFLSAAVTFVREWGALKPGENAVEWRRRIDPLVTAELGAALQVTDPSALPNAAPEGNPIVQFVTQDSALIHVPMPKSNGVLVTVVRLGSGLRVADVQPAVGDDGLAATETPAP